MQPPGIAEGGLLVDPLNSSVAGKGDVTAPSPMEQFDQVLGGSCDSSDPEEMSGAESPLLTRGDTSPRRREAALMLAASRAEVFSELAGIVLGHVPSDVRPSALPCRSE